MPDAPLTPLPPLPPLGRSRWRITLDELIRRSGLAGILGRVPAGGVAAVVAVLLGAVAVLAVSGLRARGPDEPAALLAAAPEPAAPVPGLTTTTAADLVVDVAGAVVHPGLVRVPAGTRVAEVIVAAGGPTADADLRQVNQARVLTDGEQVVVPRQGEVLPAPPAPAGKGGPGMKPSGPLDLNGATADQLDALPGVGPATAAAIVEWRGRNGRFRSVDDLLEVPGIGPSKLARLRPLVRV